MHSYGNVLAPSARLLARRLDQLRSTLDSLGSRLREAVSAAVGETVGVVVRDTVNHALDHLAGFLPRRDTPPAPSSVWNEEDDSDLWPHEGWEADEPEPCDKAPPAERLPNRLALSVSAGLHAAAWWLRRWTGRLELVSTTVIGVCASCAVYVAPALAAAGLRLIGSADQLGYLRDSVQSLATP